MLMYNYFINNALTMSFEDLVIDRMGNLEFVSLFGLASKIFPTISMVKYYFSLLCH